MNILGEKVISTLYGEGVIVEECENKVSIRFQNSVKQFAFFAFGKDLKAERDEVQNYCIEKSITSPPSLPKPTPQAPHPPTPEPVLPVKSESRKFFYVFQGKTYERELYQKFIFAPYSSYKRKIHHWERMEDIREGDIILQGVDGEIIAISEAASRAYKIDMPAWSEGNGDFARRVDVNPILFKNPLLTKAYQSVIKKTCTNFKYAPFNKNGTGNQGYLYNLPKELAAFFLDRSIQKNPFLEGVCFIQDTLKQLK